MTLQKKKNSLFLKIFSMKIIFLKKLFFNKQTSPKNIFYPTNTNLLKSHEKTKH
jgi:hypothetical protein